MQFRARPAPPGFVSQNVGRRPDGVKGFILDGFPRNIVQAEALEEMLGDLRKPLEAVVLLNVDMGILFNRLTGSRRSIVGDEPGITRDRNYG